MKYIAQLQDLHCESCKKIIEKRLSKLEGISHVEVDITQQTAAIQSESLLKLEQLQEALKDTDYKVTALKEI